MRLLTFDQIIRRAVEGLSADGPLTHSLRGMVRHVFVDEQQDLNPAQVELLARMRALGATLTAVGDDDQAIYQWRGGDASLFVKFPHRFRETKRRPLTENRRSLGPIVEAANLVAGRIKVRISKEMAPFRDESAESVELSIAELPDEEGRLTAQLLQEAHEQGLPWGSMAVLLRSVRSGAPKLVPHLVGRGIKYHIAGTTNLLSRPEIEALATILVWFAGRGSWRPDPYWPPKEITDRPIMDLISHYTGARGKELEDRFRRVEELGDLARANPRLDIVRLVYELLPEIGLGGPGSDDEGLQSALGIFVSLLSSFSHAYLRARPAREEGPRETAVTYEAPAAEKGTDLPSISIPSEGRETEATVRIFAPGERILAALASFLETYGAEGKEPPSEEPIETVDAVHVMTVHQAKGLEFPLVVVPLLTEGRFPVAAKKQMWLLPRRLFNPSRYEGGEDDERRLFYVAITRARDRLVLSTHLRDGRGKRKASRFLKDLAPMEARGTLRMSKKPSVAGLAYGRRRREAPLLRISFTELWDYAECGYRYALRRKGYRAPLDPALGYGKVVHHILSCIGRRAIAGQRPIESHRVSQEVERHFYLPFAGGESRATLKESIRRILMRYIDEHSDDFQRIVETERRFEVPLADARIVGRIDYVLSSPKGIEIVEFKVKKDEGSSERERHQVRLYAEAMRREGVNPARGWIHRLTASGQARIPVELDEPPPENFLEEMAELVAGMRNRRFHPAASDLECRGCDFAKVCPHGGR